MNIDKDKEYYSMMLNSISGIEDDLGANQAPYEAIELIRRIFDICYSDFKCRFANSAEDERDMVGDTVTGAKTPK